MPLPPARPRPRGDAGAVLLGWATKLLLTLTVLGLTGHDAFVLGVGRFTAEDDARSAARVAAQTFRDSGSAQAAYESALAEVADDEGRIDPAAFVVDATGGVTLTLQTEARTLLASRFAATADWGVLSTTASARRPD